ncbi:recombinase family protein [Chloroflexota bacterium]
MMDKKIVRVAVYARVSTQEQAVEGTSLEHQSEQLESYCQAQGWQIFQKYVDPGYTGKDANRPGLKRLLAEAKLGLFDKVVVYRMDRLARNLRLLLELEDKLKEHGVSFHSVSETFDTSTASGRHFLQMLGMISEWERETIIERTKAGRLQRYREGCWAVGRNPYGYSYDSETKKLVIKKEQAAVVHRIFQLYSTGKSMAYIANTLNSENIPPRDKKGKGWRVSTIRDILANPMFAGTQYVNHGLHISKLLKENPKDAIKIKVPRIVSDILWKSAQEHRRGNKHVQPMKREPWLLHGLISCGLCGHAFMVQPNHNRRTYNCRGRLHTTHLGGSPKCTVPNLDADWLEKELLQRIEDILNNPNKLQALLQETIDSLRNREEELSDRIQPIDQRLTKISEQKAKLAEDWVKQNMNPTKYREMQQSLQNEENHLLSIRGNLDPAQVEELECTQGLLRFWEGQLKSMAWNTENEDGTMVRNVDMPHKIVMGFAGFEDKDMTKAVNFPATKRELLDMLQVRLTAYEDRVDVKAIFVVDPIKRLLCTSAGQPTH